ncbi:A/G-specific adenine glycosylase [Leptospira sp. 2 VSF19]|uniref:Adenine DNA glycosylase n=1 Tax=Leptospira soteropolitanensis TaxID=2950025 RepID=A0AAW5VEQ2_9LEPT|nr:A/G-specific adenine glycosylase [Leptospira soteropolitanensis]MCW7492972.1 A/G-specific adenine glycosylase [Leptospira soteropolitanensis]MCW7500207.1 A/G-specific adenine glycosylase [Leptospira soteropolitanensis]MCW7522458.1 A/G-specific adenine glycosylase [Leptospira soteropolitanensis]MCW7526314.1 A/G-specific adenine glycosylase [Leptospira soteropolitanensis]MCW7529574.1 A/G-specific adenine glycosylase [Leptospira soteropolitanensis]
MNPQKKLQDWYQIHKRDLPFRKKKQAYPIWVSEVMLQQTRVNAMLPLFESFMKRFPTPESLASAEEEEVLAHWKGLGYYSRARNLRKAAIFLVQNYNGSFPKDLNLVLKLPGIGNYTARAILSIAYDLPLAVLDGNVKRVLSRYFGYTENILGPKADTDLQKKADDFLYHERPGDHNQALMELGATLCLPESPKCLLCPLTDTCYARVHQKTGEIPLRVKEKKQVHLSAEILVFDFKDKILLVKEPKMRFLKEMFHLPYGFIGEIPEVDYEPTAYFLALKNLFPDFLSIGQFKHTITHHKMNFSVLRHSLKEQTQVETLAKNFGVESKWVNFSSLDSEFPSSLASKVKKFLLYLKS